MSGQAVIVNDQVLELGPAQIKNAIKGLTSMLELMKPAPGGGYSYLDQEEPNKIVIPGISDIEYSDLSLLCSFLQDQAEKG